MHFQKVGNKQTNFFKLVFLASWRSLTKIAGDQRHGSADPDPYQNVRKTGLRGTVPDGECDHGELCEDESCEADGHHVDELLLEEQQRPEHDDGALVVSQVLRIRDVYHESRIRLFSIPDPGYEFFFHPGSRIHIKDWSILTQNIVFF